MFQFNQSMTCRSLGERKRLSYKSIVVVFIAMLVYTAEYSIAAVECDYGVYSEWNAGAVAYISVTNSGDKPLALGDVLANFSGPIRIESLWNGVINGDSPYIISAPPWASTLYPSQSLEIGFQLSKNGGDLAPPELAGVCSQHAMLEASFECEYSSQQEYSYPSQNSIDCNATNAINSEHSISYQWDFGDGASASGRSVSHQYTEAGIFPVTLTLSDGNTTDAVTRYARASQYEMNCNVSSGLYSGSIYCRVSGIDGSWDREYGWTGADYLSSDGPTYSAFLPQMNISYGISAEIYEALPAHVDIANTPTWDAYNHKVTLRNSYYVAGSTSSSSSSSSSGGKRDNPFQQARWYVNPEWSENASSVSGSSTVVGHNTAVWIDQIALIDGYEDNSRMGLRAHLDEALAQNAELFVLALDNIPSKNCYNTLGTELSLSNKGLERYQQEFITPIINILGEQAYSDLDIAVVFGMGSLPLLITGMSDPNCIEVNGAGGYRDVIRYTLDQLNTLPNVYSYLDIAGSAWLGWSDNFDRAVTIYLETIESTALGADSIAGFAVNVGGYTPIQEPFLPDPNLQVGGKMIKSSDFYEWNNYFDELSYAIDWRAAMIEHGLPESVGLLIDTGRNGWGSTERPRQVSESNTLNTFVNESRIDQRSHRANRCNQPGGLGARPVAAPVDGVDAYLWVWPPGTSDGVSDAAFQPDPNAGYKLHQEECNPDGFRWAGSRYPTEALPDAPHTGHWFPAHFELLLENAFPALESD